MEYALGACCAIVWEMCGGGAGGVRARCVALSWGGGRAELVGGKVCVWGGPAGYSDGLALVIVAVGSVPRLLAKTSTTTMDQPSSVPPFFRPPSLSP